MRIEWIRFANLNALVGEWSIDLTHPDYLTDGIFAITGPTGAGKTTVLDAICLAIFGRTPRLDRINKTGNEIMSRQCGFCFAEVIFAASSGRYRCFWSQKRAWKRPDGELQAPNHELVDIGKQIVLDRQISTVARRVESLIGMDYIQFTRSIMLAQGGFAEFLQAPPDGRAPILEQITGTEVYSRISQQVYKLYKDAQDEVNLLNAQAAVYRPASDTEIEEWRAQLSEQRQCECVLGDRLRETRAAIAWLNTVDRLEGQRVSCLSEIQDWGKRNQDFARERARLREAVRALELAADDSRLQALRAIQLDEQALRAQAADQLTVLQAEREETDARLRVSEQNWLDIKAERIATEPQIRQVRELDRRLTEGKQQLANAQQALANTRSKKEVLCTQAEQAGVKLDGLHKQLRRLEAVLVESAADQILLQTMAGIRHIHDHWADLKAHQKTLNDIQVSKGAILRESADREAERVAELVQARIRTRQAIDQQGQQQNALDRQLRGLQPDQWREKQTTVGQQLEWINRLQALSAEADQHQRHMSELDQAASDLERAIHQSQTELLELRDRQSVHGQELASLEEKLSLVQQIVELSEIRHRLADGTPCPLCGAIEHPYAIGQLPQVDPIRSRVDEVRGLLRQLSDAMTTAQIKQTADEAALLLNHDRKRELSTGCQRLAEAAKEAAIQLQLPIEPLPLAEIARSRLEDLRMLFVGNRQQIEALLNEVTALGQRLEQCRLEREQALESERETERLYNQAQQQSALAKQADDIAQQNLRAGETAIGQALADLREALEPYAVDLDEASSDEQLERLERRRDRWQEYNREQVTISRSIADEQALVEPRRQRLDELTKQAESELEIVKRLERQQAEGREERSRIFGDRDPDDVETGLAARMSAAEDELGRHRVRSEKCRLDVRVLEAHWEALGKSIGEREAQIQTVYDRLQRSILAAGFADECSYRAAILPEDARQRLNDEATRLDQEQVALQARLQDIEMQLRQERARERCAADQNSLALQAGELEAELSTVQQMIGAQVQRLEEQERLQRERQLIQDNLEGKLRIYTRRSWLNLLIGSADGKKYRIFVQGLTFGRLIVLANRQLSRLSSRYILARDEKQPLELTVIDNDQGGLRRSTKNLSGGESFLVSLALALGLSRMVSGSIRIDSLFLDEGFGTLDEDALDSALNTLADLRSEGKLIGIISHVPAIKERIATQIQVIPISGGRSALKGPGCSQKYHVDEQKPRHRRLRDV